MIAVDTNVLVRLLINDPDSQHQVNLAKELLRKNKSIFIAQIVQVELVWVLETAYGFNKLAVITVLRHLQQTRVFILESFALFSAALDSFESHAADFSDCLILYTCLENRYDIYTFDKKFARLDPVKLLNQS